MSDPTTPHLHKGQFFDATATTVRKWLRKRGHFAHFIPRAKMTRRHAMTRAQLVNGLKLPATPLPCDTTANRTVQAPMDGNDTFGDCGYAMVSHVHGILTYAQGKRTEDVIAQAPLIAQYLRVEGGDNGCDESDLIAPGTGVWYQGIAGDTSAIIVDALDLPNDQATIAYCIDQFYAVCMAWSVPDAFLNEFQTGMSFLSPMRPDPNNGHYTPLSGLDASGNADLWTWGGWCIVSWSFIMSVDPVFFTQFSPRQFDPATGFDSKGRHVTVQGQKWVALGGSASAVASVVAMFPAIAPPPPAGTPPVITGLSGASAVVGVPFSAQIQASNSPTSFSATGLPAGLGVNATTGVISGTPTTAGTSSVTLSATNASGTGTGMWTLTVAPANPIGAAPVITSPSAESVTLGTPFHYSISATNAPTSFTATGLPAGLTLSGAVISGTPTIAGVYSVKLGASNANGIGNENLTITVAAVVPPASSSITLNGPAFGTLAGKTLPIGGASGGEEVPPGTTAQIKEVANTIVALAGTLTFPGRR